MISVIIPTYKAPAALELCLDSAIRGQVNNNQIIVVVDGFYDLNESVLVKYSKHIDLLNLESNVGTCRATNLGVYNSKYDKILIVNDDNVFPEQWDVKLESVYKPSTVITPNQIEPYPSMFRQMHIRDLGRDPKSFSIDAFWEYEKSISKDVTDLGGSTYPIFMNKMDYMRIGAYPEDYPSPSGFVADWEFFMLCHMNSMKMERTYNCHFYHFVSTTAKTGEQIDISKQYEIDCHEYAKYKWGSYIKHDPINNIKSI